MKSPFSSALPRRREASSSLFPAYPTNCSYFRAVLLHTVEGEGEGETAAAFGRRKEEERVCVCVGGGLFSPDPSHKRFLFWRERPRGGGGDAIFSFLLFFRATSDFFPIFFSPVWLRDFSGREESESGEGEVLRPWEYWVYKYCKVSKVRKKKFINDMQNKEECSPSRTFGVA